MSLAKKGLAVLLIIWTIGSSFSPKAVKSNTALLKNNADTSFDDRKLAMQYCQNCHVFPEPELLDKHTWVTSVLPNMGLRLGIREPGKDPFMDLDPIEEKIMRELNVYPETPSISNEDWQKIVKYFEREAPEKPLPQKPTPPILNEFPGFKAITISVGNTTIPKTTLLKFDKNTSSLYVGDAENALYVLNSSFQLKDQWWIDTPPTDIDFPRNAPPRLLTIGVFKPSDQKLGRLMSLERSTNEFKPGINIQSLPRPVQFTTGDLNMDGKEDVLISGFGNHSGKLFWYDDFNPDKEHLLKGTPGARKTVIGDFNKDKKPDIMVLMAQGREEMSIFFNQGNGKFKEKTILSFPPLYGVSYFELVDFNKDGFQDIILTNGDNWDISSVEKNYHGLRIYLNDGKNNFKESWFYPLHGASKAIARDFDNDGDIDIVATSFYSDPEHPEYSFIYFSNQGNLKFQSYSTPEAASGKWLTMETGDFDNDGDIDIVLGSYFHTIGEVAKLAFKGITSYPQLLVLQNQQK